jgi:PAS domain S-box-containing protein
VLQESWKPLARAALHHLWNVCSIVAHVRAVELTRSSNVTDPEALVTVSLEESGVGRDGDVPNGGMASSESDSRLRSILEAANVIAWEVDLVGNSVHSTGPVRRMLSRPEGLVPPDFAAMVETIHIEDRDRVMAEFWSALSAATNFRFEFRLHPDGLRWVTAEGSIVRDTDGRAVRVRGITHDITERKRAELALAERDAQLWLAGKAGRVGSFAIDIGTGKVRNSPGYATIHGLAEGTVEFPYEDWRLRVHPDDLGRLDALRAQALAEQRSEQNTEYRIAASDGSVRWIETRTLTFYDSSGRPTRVVGVDIDITERKRAEQEKDVLIAELDHRVKNVLASVAVIARRTSEGKGSTSDFIDVLDHRIQSMAGVHDLLSRNHWQEIALAHLVERELAPYATADNAMIDGPYVGLPVKAAQAMATVLHELATNAAKYGALSTSGGRVSVRWHRLSNGGSPFKLRLEWREEGGPAVASRCGAGYGTSIIRDLIPYELGGTAKLVLDPNGVYCTIEVVVEGENGA